MVLMVIVIFGWWGDAKRSVIIAPSSAEATKVVPQAASAVALPGVGTVEAGPAPEEAIAPVPSTGGTHE